jgi:hypothetical protein
MICEIKGDFAELADRNQKTRETQRNEADVLCAVELTIVVLCDSNDKKRARRLESAKIAREQVNVDHEENIANTRPKARPYSACDSA